MVFIGTNYLLGDSKLLGTDQDLKKDTRVRAKHRRHVSNSIIWFVVLTFPIWLIWFLAWAEQPPLEIYLVLIPVSYYVILVLAPYIGVPWILVVLFLATREFRKRMALRHRIRGEKTRTLPENTDAGESTTK